MRMGLIHRIVRDMMAFNCECLKVTEQNICHNNSDKRTIACPRVDTFELYQG